MARLVSLVYQGKPDSLLWRRSLIPTTSLYFLNSCEDLVTDKARDGMVQQVGANSFRTQKANLVIRQDLPEIIARAMNDRSRRLIYLLDDNVEAFATDAGLPAGYRKRLEERWEKTFQPLLWRADRILVCSDYLQHHLSRFGKTVRADPVWKESLVARLRDRLAMPAAPGTIQVAYLGTGSHYAELMFLQPVLLQLLRRRENVVLTLPAGSDWPREIASHPRVRMRWPVPWFQYEEQLVHEAYDICLYPSLDTPFAAGRSDNKITEQALTGAFGLFSESWSHAAAVQRSGAGALAPNREECWLDALEVAIDGLPAWRERAGDVARVLVAKNDPAPLRTMWQDLLGLEGDAG